LDLQSPPAKAETEGQPAQSLRQPRREAERAAMVAHAAEAGNRDDPRARQRGDVKTIARVVLEVAQVDQGSLAEVVVGQLEMPDLCRDHRLGASRERGIAD